MSQDHEIIPETITTRKSIESVQHQDEFGRTIEIIPTNKVKISGLCKKCGVLVSVGMVESKHKPAKNTDYLNKKHQEDLCRTETPELTQESPQIPIQVTQMLGSQARKGRPAKHG